MVPWKRNTGQMCSLLAVSRPSAATACTADNTSSKRRRSKRSATGPAMGEARKEGSEKLTYATDTRNSLPVASCTRLAIATNENQSPVNDTTWAMNNHRRSALVRSSRSISGWRAIRAGGRRSG